MTFWGSFRGPKEIWDKIHESRPGHDHPAHPAGHPVDLPGHVPGPAARRQPDPPLDGAGLRGGPGDPPGRGPRRGGVRALRHRWRADPGERRPSRSSASSWPGACSASASRASIASRSPTRSRTITARAPFLYRASLNKWWFDELNHLLFIVVGGKVANAMWWFDREVVDGTVNSLGRRHAQDRPRPATRPDRPGPELRPRHRRGPDRHGRLVPAAGPAMIDVGTFPILSLIAFLPLIGAIAVAILPASLARGTALGVRPRDVGRVAGPAGRLPCRRIARLPVRRVGCRGSRTSGSPTRSARTAWRSRSSS